MEKMGFKIVDLWDAGKKVYVHPSVPEDDMSSAGHFNTTAQILSKHLKWQEHVVVPEHFSSGLSAMSGLSGN